MSTPSPGITRYGFTETNENAWMSIAPLALHGKILRRIISKAGGLAGELLAQEFDPNTSPSGAADDERQIGGGLSQLGMLPSGTSKTPTPYLKLVISDACRTIQQSRHFFDGLRLMLLTTGRVDKPTLQAYRTEQEDDSLLAALRTIGTMTSPSMP